MRLKVVPPSPNEMSAVNKAWTERERLILFVYLSWLKILGGAEILPQLPSHNPTSVPGLIEFLQQRSKIFPEV